VIFKVKTELKHLLILTFFSWYPPSTVLIPHLTWPAFLPFFNHMGKVWGVMEFRIIWKSWKWISWILLAQLLWEVSTIAGWLAACLYRVVEVEGGLLICLWFKNPLRIFLKESIAAILKPMLAATKRMLFRFYWIACGYGRSSWFWQPGQWGRRREAFTLLCLTWWCNIYTIKIWMSFCPNPLHLLIYFPCPWHT